MGYVKTAVLLARRQDRERLRNDFIFCISKLFIIVTVGTVMTGCKRDYINKNFILSLSGMKIDGSLTDRLTAQIQSVASDRTSTDMTIATAPARVDVLGGLSMEAGGVVAQMALPNRAGVALQWRNDGKIIFMGREHRQRHQPVIVPGTAIFPSLQTSPGQTPHETAEYRTAWIAPLLHVFRILTSRGLFPPALHAAGSATGVTVVIDSNIRPQSGQAAATAVTAAFLQALTVNCGIVLTAIQKAQIISAAQSATIGGHGHVIDGLTVLSAEEGPLAHLLRYRAQPHSLLGQIPLAPDIRIMTLDTGISCDNSRNIFGEFHLTGAMGARMIETIYRDLGQQHNPIHDYLGNVSPELYRRYFRAMLPRRIRGSDFLRTYGPLEHSIGEVIPENMYAIRTTLDHLISEYEHAEHFLQAMEELSESQADTPISAPRRLIMQRAGRLMLASHHSYRLRLQLSCPQADWLVDQLTALETAAGAYGARITDCGGGGTVVVLMDTSERATDALLSVISRYKQTMGLEVEVQSAGAAGSAGALI